MNKRQLADKLREQRELLGISQAELARRVKVGQAQVSRWESALQMPSAANLGALANQLGIDLPVLYQWVLEASQDELSNVRRDRDELLAQLENIAGRMERYMQRIEGAKSSKKDPNNNGGRERQGQPRS